MRPELQVFLSGCLTFGVPLILALRELVVLRRGNGGGWRPRRVPETAPRPLPPCLLVPTAPRRPAPVENVTRTRELELV
jgi:hypothetical protein